MNILSKINRFMFKFENVFLLITFYYKMANANILFKLFLMFIMTYKYKLFNVNYIF